MGTRLNQPRVVVQAMSKRCEKEWWLLDEREGMSHKAWMHNTWGGRVGRLSQNWNGGCWREQWGAKNDEMRVEDKDTWGILKTVGNMCKSQSVRNRAQVTCFMLNGWATVTTSKAILRISISRIIRTLLSSAFTPQQPQVSRMSKVHSPPETFREEIWSCQRNRYSASPTMHLNPRLISVDTC